MHSFDETPLNRALGFQLRSLTDGRAEIAMPIQPWFFQENGIVHGGVITSLADTASVYAAGGPKGMVGIEFKLNFLKAAAPDGAELVARASIVRKGRTIAVSEVDVFQRDDRIATGLFTFLILTSS